MLALEMARTSANTYVKASDPRNPCTQEPTETGCYMRDVHNLIISKKLQVEDQLVTRYLRTLQRLQDDGFSWGYVYGAAEDMLKTEMPLYVG